MTFSEQYIRETIDILKALDTVALDAMVDELVDVRAQQGRLFILGVGGSAATASHAVNDFRKIAGIESYAPTDNVAELTARTNDDGWHTVFAEWLRVARVGPDDALLVFSVGGGSTAVSYNIVRALDYAYDCGAVILGIVGRNGGYTTRIADCCIVIPPLVDERITQHTEGIAGVILHLLVSHPSLCSR